MHQSYTVVLTNQVGWTQTVQSGWIVMVLTACVLVATCPDSTQHDTQASCYVAAMAT